MGAAGRSGLEAGKRASFARDTAGSELPGVESFRSRTWPGSVARPVSAEGPRRGEVGARCRRDRHSRGRGAGGATFRAGAVRATAFGHGGRRPRPGDPSVKVTGGGPRAGRGGNRAGWLGTGGPGDVVDEGRREGGPGCEVPSHPRREPMAMETMAPATDARISIMRCGSRVPTSNPMARPRAEPTAQSAVVPEPW